MVWELLDRADTARGSRPTTYERRKEAFGGLGYLTLPTSTKLALAGAGRRDICLQQRPFYAVLGGVELGTGALDWGS
jgi:hypothetical protein